LTGREKGAILVETLRLSVSMNAGITSHEVNMPTIVDVAKRAGVSVSTVSYALNGTRPISEGTKRRVHKAVGELDYHPNFIARSLATKRTRVIALLLPSSAVGLTDSQLQFVTSAAEVASKHRYGLLLWTSPAEDEEIIQLARQGLVEGLMLMEVRLHDPRIEMLIEDGYPFSMIGRCENNDGISYVDYDFEQALGMAVRHLAELGHKHIAFLGYPAAEQAAGYGPAVRTSMGFAAACSELDIRGEARDCEATLEGGTRTMRALLSENPDLSAAIVADDQACAGVIQLLREQMRDVPRDFSVVAKVFPRLAEMTTPPLTTIDIPGRDMGRKGIELLIREVEGEEHEPAQILLPAALTVRQSTGVWTEQGNPAAKPRAGSTG
jgi:DNA-binding LacI/PurR family transcriptional regulator